MTRTDPPRRSRTSSVLVVAVALLFSAGCTAVGAGVGAVVGAQADRRNPARGAVLGATAGALTGLAIDQMSSCSHCRRDVRMCSP